MNLLFYILLNVLIIGLFLYSKLLPYKDKLNPKYKKVFGFFNSIFSPIFNFLKGFFKPFQVGNGIAIDMTQMIILVLLLFLLRFFR